MRRGTYLQVRRVGHVRIGKFCCVVAPRQVDEVTAGSSRRVSNFTLNILLYNNI